MKAILLSIFTLFIFSAGIAAEKYTNGPGDRNPVIKSYPNPISTDVTIEVQLSSTQYNHVVIKIVNLLGQEMVPAVSEDITATYSTYKVDIRDIPNGFYFMEVTTTSSNGLSYTSTKKITKN